MSMLAIKGKYRMGKIELQEPMPPGIECADLNIVVIPTEEPQSQNLSEKNQQNRLIAKLAEKMGKSEAFLPAVSYLLAIDDDPEEDKIWESYSK